MTIVPPGSGIVHQVSVTVLVGCCCVCEVVYVCVFVGEFGVSWSSCFHG